MTTTLLVLALFAAASPNRASAAALGAAAEGDDLGALRALLDAGSQVDARGERDWTALHHAVIAGRAEAAALLLERGADPNARGQFDLTPVHWAAMKGRADLVKLLVRRGGRMDARDLWGRTPLHEAADDTVVRTLADLGADINAADQRGFTPLHLARNEETANALLAMKADLRLRTRAGQTALELQVADGLAKRGLVLITSRTAGRLRGERGRMEVLVRNVTEKPFLALELAFQSAACSATAQPPRFDLAPGELAVVPVDLARAAGVGDGDQPLSATVSAGGQELARLALKVNTSRGVTPEDQGLIHLGSGSLRKAPGAWSNLAFVVVPILALAIWLLGRRLSRRRS